MKLQAELDFVTKSLREKITPEMLLEHIESVKSEAKDLRMRVVWDACRYSVGVDVICGWYKQYDCHDPHIYTLFKAAVAAVFPDIYKNL